MALVTAAAVAALLFMVWLIEPSLGRLLATLLALALLAAALLRSWRRATGPHEVRVSGTGQIEARGEGGATGVLRAVYLSGWLICLRDAGGRSLSIWRDSVSPQAFRRLSVAARWSGAPTTDSHQSPHR